MQKYMAEIFGTFTLVLLGCGSAIFAGTHIGFVGVALSFGFALMLLAYLLGPISGCHLNPAVTITLAITKKFNSSDVVPYIISQLIGAVLAGYVLSYVAHGKEVFTVFDHFACNGFGEHSPDKYNMISCLIIEVLMTLILLKAVLATTRCSFPAGFAGLFVGVTLAVIHLVSIPVTNTSVNLARTLGVAVVHGGWALEQIWLFALAHVIAIVLAVGMHNMCNCNKTACDI